jgi:hypothetical protein
MNIKFMAIPAIALATGLGMAACSQAAAPQPTVTHTVTAAPVAPKPSLVPPTHRAPTYHAPAVTHTAIAAPKPAVTHAQPTAAAQLTGKWYVHGLTLIITGGTGTMTWNAGPTCDSASICSGNASVAFTPNGNAITGTLGTVWYTSGGQTVSNIQTEGLPQQGDSFTLTATSNQNLLHITWLGAAAASSGNPNLCREGYTSTVCGA